MAKGVAKMTAVLLSLVTNDILYIRKPDIYKEACERCACRLLFAVCAFGGACFLRSVFWALFTNLWLSSGKLPHKSVCSFGCILLHVRLLVRNTDCIVAEEPMEYRRSHVILERISEKPVSGGRGLVGDVYRLKGEHSCYTSSRNVSPWLCTDRSVASARHT